MQFLKLKTFKLRYRMAKMLVPRLYNSWLTDVIETRPMIRFAEVHFKDKTNLVGIEIGVAEGRNSVSIIRTLKMKTLYLIDPYNFLSHDSAFTTENDYFLAKERLALFPQAVFIKTFSENAIKNIHELVDFVYVDGNHAYEYVKNDLALYFPIVKQNGIIGGHDYNSGVWLDVKKAVDEFAHQNNSKLYVQSLDWWVVK
jgi:hypothetical protein